VSRLREHPLPVAGGLLVLVLAMRAYLEWVGPLPGDTWSAGLVRRQPLQDGPLFDVAMLMAALGSGAVAVVVLPAALWFVRRAWGPEAFVLVAVAMGVVVLNAALKWVLGPTPPFAAVVFKHPSPHNFPSGHTAYATAFYGTLALVAVRAGRKDVAAVFAALVVLMGPARVAGGFHLVSDVVAGYAVGAAWLLAVTAARSRRAGGSPRRATRPFPG
jgi:undecaprenyl-diphosphatase